MARVIKIDNKPHFIYYEVYQVTPIHVQSFIIYVQEIKFINSIQHIKSMVICVF